jgi:hexokinase
LEFLARSSSEEYADFIAESIQNFMLENHIGSTRTLPIGLTFGFPVKEIALNQGILLNWNKGFKVANVVGQDVVKLLQDALNRKHVPVRCDALVNDVHDKMCSFSVMAHVRFYRR